MMTTNPLVVLEMMTLLNLLGFSGSAWKWLRAGDYRA